MAGTEPQEEKVSLDPTTLKNLSPEALARLQSEFGVTVEMKSSKPGLAAMLDGLTKSSVSVNPSLANADYDRSFDRTNPGYDRFYDRDKAMTNIMAQVSNPAPEIGAVARTQKPSG